jgi:hypothetical protein
VRRLLLALIVVLALPARAPAREATPDLERDPVGFLVEALRCHFDLLEIAPYGAEVVLGTEWRPFDLDFHFDLRQRHVRLHLGAGRSSVLAVGLRAEIALEGIASRVRTRLDLGVAGHGFSLKLPDVVVVPRFVAGRVVMEIRVPLVEARF